MGSNTLPLKYEWVPLLDADEVVTPSAREIRAAMSDPGINGYHVGLQMRLLAAPSFSGARFWNASFRREKGRFECRLAAQDSSMADIEIEHVIVDGPTAFLKQPLIHHNIDSLSRYIRKHDEYSNWESEVLSQTLGPEDLQPHLWLAASAATLAQEEVFALPGSPVALFLYRYLFCFGFLDGIPGLIYCGFQTVKCSTLRPRSTNWAPERPRFKHVRHQRTRELGNRNTLARMNHVQVHRGPDGAGIWERSFPDGSYVGSRQSPPRHSGPIVRRPDAHV